MERVTVTGAGGFIGNHLVARLLEEGCDVLAVDIKPLEEWWRVSEQAHNRQLDASDPAAALECCDGRTAVYDLAEDMGGVGWLTTNRLNGLLSLRIAMAIVEAAANSPVPPRVFFASSACAYNTDLQEVPGGDSIVLTEGDAWPARPERGYGEAKLMAEQLCAYATEEYSVETRIARYHNVYGPNGSWTGGREKAPAAICRKVAEAVETGRHIIDIWGDGEQTRSFMFIDDCVEGTLRIMDSNYPDPLNLGSAEMVTINQLVDVVEQVAGLNPGQLERRHDLTRPQGVRGRSSDNTLIGEQLGWWPSITLQDGLARTYEWVHAQVKERGVAAS